MDKNQVVQKKRGRPVGSKNKVKTVRPDKQPTTQQGENTKFLTHDMKLYNLPKIDVNDINQVEQRIKEYFSICAEDDIKPSVSSFALSLGISRITLFTWLTGKYKTVKSQECLNALKTAYDLINSYYEHLMNTGKINPVAGIFLLKNNYGYQDTTTHVIQTSDNADPTTEDITDKAGLLE